MAERKTFLTGRAFYLFLLYTVWIWFCELADLTCYYAGLPQITPVSMLVAAALTLLFARKVIGRVGYSKLPAGPWFVLGSAVLLVFFAFKSIRPDLSYDTCNYHLLSQVPGFTDNIQYNVLPGRFQMFGFRLGDRMFDPFRALLGLRMGTMLNAAAMLVIYRQTAVLIGSVKRELSGVAPSGRGLFEGRLAAVLTDPSLLAFLVVCRADMLMQSGTYMVELLALPFLLEMLSLLLAKPGTETYSGSEAFIFCLCGGLLFCLKMTNIIYLVPLVLLYLWKIRKSVTPGLFLRCLAAGVIPVCIYLAYNMTSTGNPVFPYFNTVFRSPYFPAEDFKDARWGPQGMKELLLWPWYMIRYPDYRLTEIVCTYNLDLLAGYAAMAVLAVLAAISLRKGRSRGFRRELLLMAVYVSSFFLWAATTGHIRYFMGGLIIGALFPTFVFLRAAARGRFAALAAGAVLMLPLAGRAWYGFSSVYTGQEWSWRVANREEVKNNMRWVLRDQKVFPKEIQEQTDLLFLTWGEYGSFARLAGGDTPIWNYAALNYELAPMADRYLSHLEEQMRGGLRVRDMFPQGKELLGSYLEWENEIGYYVEELCYPENAINGLSAYTFARLTPADGRENRWYYCKSGAALEGLVPEAQAEAIREAEGKLPVCDVPLTVIVGEEPPDGQRAGEEPPVGEVQRGEEPPAGEVQRGEEPSAAGRYRMRALLGNPDYCWNPAGFQVTVTASDGRTERTAAVLDAGAAAYGEVDVPLDLSGLDGEVTLSFTSSSPFGLGVIVNPELTPE